MQRRDSNPRLSGYEPDTLPDCATLHQIVCCWSDCPVSNRGHVAYDATALPLSYSPLKNFDLSKNEKNPQSWVDLRVVVNFVSMKDYTTPAHLQSSHPKFLGWVAAVVRLAMFIIFIESTGNMSTAFR